MRPRFSLRTLLVVTLLVALFCYWLMLPTLHAQKFIAAVKAGDFARADALFRSPKDQFLANHEQTYWTFRFSAAVLPLTARDFFHGTRRLSFDLAYGGPRPVAIVQGTIDSTARGLGPLEWNGGVFGGMAM